jgi:hypothetical protein
VLGDAATPEIMEAWEAAYSQLAGIMIGREAALMSEGASAPGGWQGFRPLRVVRKTQESEAMTSFVLQQPDGSGLPGFTPGQYVSVQVHVLGYQHRQVRQYTTRCMPVTYLRRTCPWATSCCARRPVPQFCSVAGRGSRRCWRCWNICQAQTGEHGKWYLCMRLGTADTMRSATMSAP